METLGLSTVKALAKYCYLPTNWGSSSAVQSKCMFLPYKYFRFAYGNSRYQLVFPASICIYSVEKLEVSPSATRNAFWTFYMTSYRPYFVMKGINCVDILCKGKERS